MGRLSGLLVPCVGLLSLLVACAQTITLADGTRVPGDKYTREHYEACESGTEPSSCRIFAKHVFADRSARWYTYMLKGCEHGHGGTCAEVSFAALGSDAAAKLTGNDTADDYDRLCKQYDDAVGQEACRRAEQMRAEAKPPAPREIATNVVDVVMKRCRLGPDDPTATSREAMGDACIAVAVLARTQAQDLETLMATTRELLPLGRRGCDLGSQTACLYLQKAGEEVDLREVEARRERWIDADVRRAEEDRRHREELARQRDEGRAWQEQYNEESMRNLQNSNESWKKQMRDIHQSTEQAAQAQRERERQQAEKQKGGGVRFGYACGYNKDLSNSAECRETCLRACTAANVERAECQTKCSPRATPPPSTNQCPPGMKTCARAAY